MCRIDRAGPREWQKIRGKIAREEEAKLEEA
jgi:hypothetical protein